MNKGKIVILSGPSGVGKGSVNKVLFQDKTLKLKYSVSMTTRAPRPGEIDGVNYFFVDKDTFTDSISHNELIEYAEFIGNYYGTPRQYTVEETLKGNNVILEIEVLGATQVLAKENNDELISIFLMPPSLSKLEERLRKRGTEGEEIIKQRLDKALLEIPLKHKYQYIIENDNVKNAVAKIKEVLQKEGVLEAPVEQSYYNKLKEQVTKILEKKFMFFVMNWKDNVSKIEGVKQFAEGFDFKVYLVNILTERVYKNVLAYQDLRSLDDDMFVETKVEHYMLDVNFFSIEQEEF